MKECAICVDAYNKVRTPVECPRCHTCACTRCIKTYLLHNTIEPKCMGCSSAWDMEFVRKNLSKRFMDSEYKKHQISALLSQAEASLGDVQRFVPIRTRLDTLAEEIKTEKAQIETSFEELGFLVHLSMIMKNGYRVFLHAKAKKENKSASCLENDPLVEKEWEALPDADKEFYHAKAVEYEDRLYKKRVELHQTRQSMGLHQNENKRLQQQWETLDWTNEMASIPQAEKTTFFMACPRKECRGRVSLAYKCGLCEHWACPECHGDKGLERNGSHKCREEDKETVRMLKKNTKHCPECQEGIFKEHGCDQMWCTRCRTCFSWSTGKKLNGTIHNPHYYEYLRQQHHHQHPSPNGGREAVIAPFEPNMGMMTDCNGFPTYYSLVGKWSSRDSGIEKEDQVMLSDTHRLTNHIRHVEIPRLRNTITDDEKKNSRKWGVEYLRNKVTRDEWGQKLYLAYRKKEREERMLNILDMFTQVAVDVYRNWYYNDMTGSEMLQSLCTLIQYTNENIRIHNQQYGTKVALLDPHTTLNQHILDYHHNYY